MALAVGATVAVAFGFSRVGGAFVTGSIAKRATVSLNIGAGVIDALESSVGDCSRNQLKKVGPLNWAIPHPSRSVPMRITAIQESHLREKTGLVRRLLVAGGVSV